MANIKVAVRVRPVSQREINVTGSEIVVHTGLQEVSLTNLKVSSSKAIDSRERTKQYCFDYCFDSSDPSVDKYASQTTIYETLGRSVLDALFAGYNACLVAYGQSASGKTYTMMGNKDDPGLIPRICEGIFVQAKNEDDTGKSSHISMSYLEVYNEKVRDLLVPTANLNGLRVREHPRLGPYVQGLTQHPVETLELLMSRVEEGTKARKTASTLQNLTSSRSHALLTLSVEPSTAGVSGQALSRGPGGSRRTDFPRGCKLHLVDLAGSENSTACAGINRLKSQEGANINKSLVALGNVISALAERSSTSQTSGRRFIPYRDSTLTWLLKDSLGGNATTIMLATISPASGSYNETSHTLRFAQRAQSVINKPVINEDPVAKIIRELRSEIVRLKALLLEKNVEPAIDCKSLCICQRAATSEQQSSKTRCVSTSTCNSPTVEFVSPLPESQTRRRSSSSSLTSKFELTNPLRQYGSLEFVAGHDNSESLRETRYNRAKVSQLIDDHVDEPVFVDIPTLVAVLIQPDNTAQVNSHQIEEISNDNVVLEDTIEFNETLGLQGNSTVSTKPTGTNGTVHECHRPSFQILDNNVTKNKPSKLCRQSSLDININSTSFSPRSQSLESNIHPSTSSEASLTPPGNPTNIGTDSKTNTLNNIKEIEDRKDETAENNEYQRKNNKAPRKQSVEGIKRKTSKDSSSSSSKDEQILISGISKDRFLGRKGSIIEPEQLPLRVHTPIQRARRAEIVAAVTERLYSSKKTPDDTNTASTPASDIRSPESSEVKFATSTRMRLQEISRKMLAKRRRICVDTQTDFVSTVRMRDVSISVEEPKIICKDASILTDRHEDYEISLASNHSTTRVKEVSTSTSESPPPKLHVLFKDACNVTEDFEDDYGAINSQQHDSGIVFDDSQTCYAESNFSSAGISDLCPDADKKTVESIKMIESSSNTCVIDDSISMSAQTLKEDFQQVLCVEKCCKPKKYSEPSHLSCRNLDYCPATLPRHHCGCRRPSIEQPERNVISISLPDMINITIESSSLLESKIQVFDANETNQKDVQVQTDKADVLEIGTVTDGSFENFTTRHQSTSTKLSGNQNDNKTFRIENIFQDPHDNLSRSSRIDETSSGLDDLLFTANSGSSLNSLGTKRKSLTTEWLTRNRNWSTLPRNHSRGRLKTYSTNAYDNYLPLNATFAQSVVDKSIEQSDDLEEVLSWQDIHTKKPTEDISDTSTQWWEIFPEIPTGTSSQCAGTNEVILDKKLSLPETNFSDDSLEPKEEHARRGSEVLKISSVIMEDPENTNDSICPPDVVAHTKRDIDSSTLSDKTYTMDDFDDTYIELPKTKPESLPSTITTPVQEFKSLILGVPLIPLVLPEEIPRDPGKKIESNKKRVSFGGSNVIETITSIPMDGVQRSPPSPRPIIKLTESDAVKPDSKINESLNNNNNTDGSTKIHNILDDYLEEAIVFMRNINLMNDTNEPDTMGKKSLMKPRNRLRSKNLDRKPRNERSNLEFGPYDRCLKSMERLEQCLTKVKHHDELLQSESAETKRDLANFSIDSMDHWSYSRYRDYSSLDDLTGKSSSRSNSSFQPHQHENGVVDLEDNYVKLQSSPSRPKRRSRSKYPANCTDTRLNEKPVKRVSNNFNTYPRLTDNEDILLARVRKSLPSPRCTISKYDSSNENSSSNEALATFMESLDRMDRTKAELKYPSSPRVKFLELLSERRRIVEDSRSTGAS